MQLEIQLDLGEGPFTVRTTLYCWVLWERKTKQKIGDLAAGPGFDDLAYLAYEACSLVDGEPDRPTEAAPTEGN
jgi:hypothetical protein